METATVTETSAAPVTAEEATPEKPGSYLMWVGKEHYPKIADFVKEAEEQGISKRLSTADVAAKLTVPGTLVFLAHDEGESVDCPKCTTEIEDPEKRKAQAAFEAAKREEQNRLRELKEAQDEAQAEADSVNEGKMTEGAKEIVERAEKLLENARKRSARLAAKVDAMPDMIKGGSGGTVTVDGEVWDHRKYNYWLHQPKRFDPEGKTIEAKQCEHCGGTGRRPCGKVFGVFMPNASEYILRPEDKDEVAKAMSEKGLELVPATAVAGEKKRGCGKRKHGGVYVTTKAGTPTDEQLQVALDKLVEEGKLKPESIEVTGNFIRFIEPAGLDEKRFRGVKRWEPTGEAAEEAAMIREALQ